MQQLPAKVGSMVRPLTSSRRYKVLATVSAGGTLYAVLMAVTTAGPRTLPGCAPCTKVKGGYLVHGYTAATPTPRKGNY